MELGEVIGTVVATLKVPSWNGQRLLRVRPIDAAGVTRGKTLVALDVTSAAPGQQVFFVRGREAAHAIDDVFNPADAAIVAQVDRLEGPIMDPEPSPPRGGKAS